MKGLFAYDNHQDKWILLCVDFSEEQLIPSPKNFARRLNDFGKEIIPLIVEREIAWLKYGVEKGRYSFELEEPLPEMPDLHQRIKANKEKLRTLVKPESANA